MFEPKESPSATRRPAHRGAATPSDDGVHRITLTVPFRLSANELIRVLLADPPQADLNALDPAQIRLRIVGVLTRHGYDLLATSAYDPLLDRHQDARRAIRRAYGPRFTDAPDEQALLADPLREVLDAWSDEP